METNGNYSGLVETTRNRIYDRVKECIDYKELYNAEDIPIEEMMDISEMTSADFLEQPLAKGIVTSTLINNFKNHSKIKERYKILLILLVDSWLSSFYELIWIERNETVYAEVKRQKIAKPKSRQIKKPTKLISNTKTVTQVEMMMTWKNMERAW